MTTTLLNDLLTSLFDGQPHLLAAPLATWLTDSKRFAAFVTTYHTKIRKKIRVAQEPESVRDLQLELETAYLFLRERALNVAYETVHRTQGRSPDFAVTFTTSLEFMVEVTRLRAAQSPPPLFGERFTEAVCSKLGQLLPQRSNLLLVGIEAPSLTPDDLHAIMLRLQQRVETNDTALMHRHAFRDRADFFNHYHRLSALLVRGGTPLQADAAINVWVNPQAKYPLPTKVRTALMRSHTL